MYVWQRQGLDAQQAGEPRSHCPYDIGTAAHLSWMQGWIHGESTDRRLAGTYGATEEQWEAAARMMGPEHRPDPCAEVTANLEEMRREDELAARKAALAKLQRERTLTAEEAAAALAIMARTSAQVMDDLTRSMHALADAAMKTFEQVVRELSPLFAAFAKARRTEAARKGAGVPIDMHRAILGLPQLPPPPRYCPRHAEEMRGGSCRRCQREQVRASSRRR